MTTATVEPENYTVNLKLIRKNGEKPYVVAVPNNLNVKRGDKVKFCSDDGKFKVVFRKSWALGVPEIRDSRTRTFKREGEFAYYCYIRGKAPSSTTPGVGLLQSGKWVWFSYRYRKDRDGGGTGNVKPPGR